jgi:hypothetical protein
MLADVPASESPAGGDCPVATVAISGDGKGDQSVGSPEVKASEREANNSAGCSKGEPISPEMVDIGSAEPLVSRRRQALVAKELGICSDRLPGDVGDDMLRRNGQRKHGTTHRWPRPAMAGTARAAHITCHAGKLRRAGEWGGWGRLSVDRTGQKNPIGSEGPWGRAAEAARMAVHHRADGFDAERREHAATGCTKGGSKLSDVDVNAAQEGLV